MQNTRMLEKEPVKDKRVSYSHQLKNISHYAIQTILGGEDGWNPI